MINLEESDYSIEEGGTLSTDIRLQFSNNQNPFTVTLTPVDIDTAEALGLGVFIDFDISAISRATLGNVYNTDYAANIDLHHWTDHFQLFLTLGRFVTQH